MRRLQGSPHVIKIFDSLETALPLDEVRSYSLVLALSLSPRLSSPLLSSRLSSPLASPLLSPLLSRSCAVAGGSLARTLTPPRPLLPASPLPPLRLCRPAAGQPRAAHRRLCHRARVRLGRRRHVAHRGLPDAKGALFREGGRQDVQADAARRAALPQAGARPPRSGSSCSCAARLRLCARPPPPPPPRAAACRARLAERRPPRPQAGELPAGERGPRRRRQADGLWPLGGGDARHAAVRGLRLGVLHCAGDPEQVGLQHARRCVAACAERADAHGTPPPTSPRARPASPSPRSARSLARLQTTLRWA